MNSLQVQLGSAVFREDISEIENFLAAGDLDSKGYTPLMQAAEIESIEIIKLLLASGANISQIGAAGYSCLHVAVDLSIDRTIQTGGNPGDEPTHILEILLDHGADILQPNDNGESALDLARKYNSEKIIHYLELKIRS